MSAEIPEADEIALRQGDTWKIAVVVYRVDAKYKFLLNGSKAKLPKNITGVTARWQLAANIGDAPLLSKTSPASGIVITDPENGLLTVTVPKEDTANLAVGAYWHEVQLDDADGNRTTVLQGRLYVKDQLIRP